MNSQVPRDDGAWPITVDVRRYPDGRRVVEVNGELLRGTVATMHRVVATELTREPAVLALDLAGITRIDAAGVDALVSAAFLAGEADISFCLVGVHRGPVGAALADGGWMELFEIFQSAAEA